MQNEDRKGREEKGKETEAKEKKGIEGIGGWAWYRGSLRRGTGASGRLGLGFDPVPLFAIAGVQVSFEVL